MFNHHFVENYVIMMNILLRINSVVHVQKLAMNVKGQVILIVLAAVKVFSRIQQINVS